MGILLRFSIHTLFVRPLLPLVSYSIISNMEQTWASKHGTISPSGSQEWKHKKGYLPTYISMVVLGVMVFCASELITNNNYNTIITTSTAIDVSLLRGSNEKDKHEKKKEEKKKEDKKKEEKRKEEKKYANKKKEDKHHE